MLQTIGCVQKSIIRYVYQSQFLPVMLLPPPMLLQFLPVILKRQNGIMSPPIRAPPLRTKKWLEDISSQTGGEGHNVWDDLSESHYPGQIVPNHIKLTHRPPRRFKDIQVFLTLAVMDAGNCKHWWLLPFMKLLYQALIIKYALYISKIHIDSRPFQIQLDFMYQNTCCAVNVWQILHDSNLTLLATNTVFKVQQKSPAPTPNTPTYFLPFLNASPILMVELYSHQLMAMLDSGCSKNLCSNTAIAKICPHYDTFLHPYHAPFSDVQGKLLSTKGILPKTQIKINDHHFVIDIVIFDSPDLTFLLGFDFVKQFDLQISAKGLILPHNICHQTLPVDTPLSPITIPARIHESVFIEATTTKLIEVNLDLHNVSISFAQLRLKHLVASSEALQPNTPFHKLSIFFQYINMPVHGRTSLQYSNFEHYSVTLHAGDIVAYVEEMMFPLPHHDQPHPAFQTKLLPHTIPFSAPSNQTNLTQNIIDHPVFNQVYSVCRHLSQVEQLTEADIEEKLSQIQYHAHRTNPTITDKDINVQSNAPDHIQFAKNLVYSHAKLFTAHPLDVGTFKGPPVNLQLKDGVEPVAQPQYPISPKLLPAARRLVSRLLRLGVVGHSTSPWNLPVFVLSKKRGEKQNPGNNDVALEQQSTTAGSIKSTDLRLILDSRLINANLSRNYQDFPIPRTIDIIHNIYGAQYIGIYDVSNAFFSHKLTRSCAQYFAWTFENLKLEMRSLPQGCVASPTIFCSYITRLITSAGLTRYATWPDGAFDGVQVYFDNIVVSARTEANYKQMLTILFDVLLDSGYRLKLSKAFFFITQKFNIFGFEISIPDQTCMPERKKIEHLLAIETPRSRRQARAILGSFGYFHTLLPNINHILSPIYNLASEKVKFIWTEVHTKALEQAKRLISKCPLLFLPNPNADFYVWTDACVRMFCSFFVYQYSKVHKSLVLISCYSHKLTLSERSFSQYHVELYSIVLFCTKYFHRIQHSRTWIFSDCAALSYAIRYKAENSCLLRYWTLLHSVDLRILFTPATHPLLRLVDLTTRGNNALKLLNRRITQNDITNFPILDWCGLPPLTLTQIEQIVNGFFNYEAKIKNNHYCPNLPKAVQVNPVYEDAQPANQKLQHWNIIKHCHAMFPACQVTISHIPLTPLSRSPPEGSTTYPSKNLSSKDAVLHNNMDFCSPVNTAQVKIPLRHYTAPSQAILPLPPASLTLDHQWVIFPQNIYAIQTPPQTTNLQRTPVLSPYVLDLILDKATLYNVINQAFSSISIVDFIRHQKLDRRLASLFQVLQTKKHLNYVIFHDVLCKTRPIQQHNNQTTTVYNILCPDSLALTLITSLHVHQMVHLNFSRLQNCLRKHWYVRNFPEVYRTMIQTCRFCALNVPQPHKQMQQALPVFYGLHDAISIDHCTVNSSWTIDGFLNITEQFSTHLTLVPLHSKATASEVLQQIYIRYISVYSHPKFLIKDNAPNLTNSLLDSITQLLKIKCIYTTPYSSRSNSKCEMGNKRALACFRLLHQTLPGGLKEEYLPIYCAGISACLNSLPLQTLDGLSPNMCMTGFHQKTNTFLPFTSHNLSPPVINRFELYQQYAHLYETLYAIYAYKREQFQKTRQQHSYKHNYKEGQFVRVREANPMRGSQRKLRPIYSSTVYRIIHLTHSTAMLLDLSAQVYFKQRLKGRGKLICPVIKRVKISQLKLTQRPDYFLQISEKQLQSLLAEIDKVPSRTVGYIRSTPNETDAFIHLDTNNYLKTLLQSPLFKTMPPEIKTSFSVNQRKLQRLKDGVLQPNQTVFTVNGIFITTNEHFPSHPSFSNFEIHNNSSGQNVLGQNVLESPKTGQNVLGQNVLKPRKMDQNVLGQTVLDQNTAGHIVPRDKMSFHPFISPKNPPGIATLKESTFSKSFSQFSHSPTDSHNTELAIVKNPCFQTHADHFPCVFTLTSSQSRSTLLPLSSSYDEELSFSNTNFNFHKFRKKIDMTHKLPPLYQRLAKRNIHPAQVFIRPFSATKINVSQKLNELPEIPKRDHYSQITSAEFPVFEPWEAYYPKAALSTSPISSIFLSSSQVTSLLQDSFTYSHHSSSTCRPTSYKSNLPHSDCNGGDCDDNVTENDDTDDDDEDQNQNDASTIQTSSHTASDDHYTDHQRDDSGNDDEKSTSEGYGTPHGNDIENDGDIHGDANRALNYYNDDNDDDDNDGDDNDGDDNDDDDNDDDALHAVHNKDGSFSRGSSRGVTTCSPLKQHLRPTSSSSLDSRKDTHTKKTLQPRKIITITKIGKPSMIKNLRKPSLTKSKLQNPKIQSSSQAADASSQKPIKTISQQLVSSHHNNDNDDDRVKSHTSITQKNTFKASAETIAKRRASLRGSKKQ